MGHESVIFTRAQPEGVDISGAPLAGRPAAHPAAVSGGPAPGTPLSVIALVVFSSGILPSLVSLALAWWLGDAEHVHPTLHEAIEFTGGGIALTAAIFLLLRSQHQPRSAHLLWVAASLLAMGLMHTVHGLMPFGLAWSWLRNAATLLGGLLFAMVWLPIPPTFWRHRRALMLGILTLTTLVTVGIGLGAERMPTALGEAGYALPAKVVNVLGGAAYVAAATFFLRRYRRRALLEDLVFACHTLILAGAALLFGFSHPWAADWWAWHVIRLLAYVILLLAGYQVIAQLYRELAGKALSLEERVQARTAELQKSEEKYRSLFDNMSEGFAIGEAICRPDGTPYDFCFLDINRGFERQSGLTRDILGKPVRQVLPKLEQQWIDTYCGVALSGTPVHFDAPNADTGKHYDVFCYSPAKGRFAIIFTDITERKRSEEALRRYELLAAYSRDIILFIRVEDGRVLEANAAAAEAYGYTREELLAMTVHELRAPHLFGDMPDQLAKADMEGILFETVHVRKDGSLLPVEVSARGVSIGCERVIISVIRDIADRKQAEKAVQQANDRLARIAKVTAAVVGAAPLREQVTILAQQAREAFDADACAMRILDGEDLVLLASTGIPSEKLPPRISAFQGVAAEVISRQRRIFIPNVHDSPISRDFATPVAKVYSFASYAGVPLIVGDRVIGILGIYWQSTPCMNFEESDLEHLQALADNITVSIVNDGLHKQLSGQRDQLEREIVERKQAVDALRESQEALQTAKDAAETANKAKDHFLSVLSHELRTPLTPVLMTASALECDDGVPAWIREDMGLVRRSVELEVKLIDDLLDINRIMRGKLALRLEEIDAHLKIISAIELCRPEAEAKKVELTADLDATSSQVSGDAGRLQQIVWNLVKNSIKFTPAGGRIHVRTLNPAEGLLRIEVQDTGIGMPPESIPRLFKAFEQADAQVTRQFGGLGLGLAICKALVEMHGGTIGGASEGAGRGATFTVDLPTVALKAAPASPETPQRPQVGAGVRILYVEDHAATSQVMQKMFARAGHKVIAAMSVRDAVAAAEKHAFDLLVCDLGLPDGSGLDIMRELRSRYPQVKGIALSGFGMDADIERSLAAGFSEHVTKPVEMPALLAAVTRVAGSG